MALKGPTLMVLISRIACAQGPPSGGGYGYGYGGSGASQPDGSNGGSGLGPGGNSNGGDAGGSSSSGNPYGSSSYGPQLGERLFGDHLLMAHGVLACLAVVVFFPAGAITIRSLPSRFVVWLHVIWQVLGYTLFVCALGIGVWMARQVNFGSFKLINQYHPVIGIVVFSFISLQPILGILHHILFKKYQKRMVWSHAHVWLGRVMITLGIINGALGLRFAENASTGQEIAYGVVAGAIWLVWMAAAVGGEVKRLRQPQHPPAYKEHADPNEAMAQPVRNDYYAKEGPAV